MAPKKKAEGKAKLKQKLQKRHSDSIAQNESDVKQVSDGSSSKYFKPDLTEGKSDKKKSKTDSQKNLDIGSRLPFSFYDKKCEDLAKALLGCKMVRKQQNGNVLSGIIVETEAYLGGEDKAAHSYNGKKTPKNEAMYMPPGTAYVYHIYGSYTCMNISSQGDGAAVLLRAIDPVDGIAEMTKIRSAKVKSKKEFKERDIGNGPSKLTQALLINKQDINKQDLTSFEELWVEGRSDEVKDADVVVSARIGVDYAAEWAKKPLRFYLKGNKSVSVKDKAAEKEMEKNE